MYDGTVRRCYGDVTKGDLKEYVGGDERKEYPVQGGTPTRLQ